MTFPPNGFPGGFQGGFPGGMPSGMPGGFPGGGQGGFPGGFPGGGQGGFPGGFPGGGQGGFPGGFPGGGQGGFPGGFPGGGQGQGSSTTPPPPSQQTINRYQSIRQNPAQAQSMLQQGGQSGITRFAAGCDGRWTIVLLRNGQLFLMYVLSSNVTGNTTGIIWPNYTFGSFPSSAIAAYSC